MGLILTAANAIGSTLADQWKEYFYCDAIPSDTICIKGLKKNGGIGNFGSDDIISDGSMIAVADGQCMLIVEQGQVVDICAEPGIYRYDASSEPSIFTGNLSDSIKNVFATIGRRFEFGGSPSNTQRIYYINTKELLGVKYGTANPIPFRIVDTHANIDMDISLKCFGEYSLKVVDPILFYTNVCANVTHSFKVSDIENQLRTELLTALQPAFARISQTGVRYSELPLHTVELANALNEELSSKWRDLRGIEIVSLGISSLKADEADEERLKNLQAAATYKDPSMAAANLAAAQADAMRDAAKNEGGAALGFIGLNAAQNAGGLNANALYAQAQNNTSQQAPTPQTTNGWICPKCGKENHDNFCSGCGTARPSEKWICPNCGKENNDNFCTNCGTKKQ